MNHHLILKQVPKGYLIMFIAMILIIIGLSAVLIFRKPEVVITGREQILQDSLTLLQQNLDSSHVRQERLQRGYDSLVAIEPKIITKTRDKVQFIFTDATPDDLDSIIRTNWKTKSRYR